ncbi:MAG: DUF2304 domain-containing protein [Anaerolineaceae bacterium]|nr:DUF2304 domain-containing protein [Anaerolineaceae bacterium]
MAQVEIIAVLGSVFLLGLILEMVRRRQVAENYALLWLITAVALFVLSLWRELLDVLASVMGIFYPPAALFVIGFGFFLLIMLQFSVIITHLSRKNKELAQQVGILSWKLTEQEKKVAEFASHLTQTQDQSGE